MLLNFATKRQPYWRALPVATKRRESRQKGASRNKKAQVATKRRESRQKGVSRDKKARLKKKGRNWTKRLAWLICTAA